MIENRWKRNKVRGVLGGNGREERSFFELLLF